MVDATSLPLLSNFRAKLMLELSQLRGKLRTREVLAKLHSCDCDEQITSIACS